ncbi:TNF receptor-associated factor 3-like [Oopsacas minuta]|uniref:TNF receptor-associated factor 3-like n=1 Tax=Oopsacas minuta TaxID=111878 RepID=A0AAV7KEQ0_9METZ|nr:TNF receptor-associated factor 3-like [Oopsacas minuta]
MNTEINTQAIRMCDEILRIKDSNAEPCGYKLTFFIKDRSTLEPLVCQSCNGIFHYPTILPCTHWFCRNCVNKKKTCPIDDDIYNNEECYVLNNLHQNIQAQPVRCVNFTKGCNWKGELRDIYKHYTDCRHTLMKCKLNCGVTLNVKEMQRHELFECQFRSLKCAFCSKTMLARDMYNHEANSCKKYGGETFWRVKVERGGSLKVSESSRMNYSNYTMKYYPRKKVVISDEPPQVSSDVQTNNINETNSRKRGSISRNNAKSHVTTDTVKKVQCLSNSYEKPAVVFTYCDSSEGQYCTDSSSECSSIGPMPRTLTRAEMKLSHTKSEKLPEIHSEDSGFFSSQEGKSSPTIPEAKLRKRKFFKSSAFSFLKKNNKSSWSKKKDSLTSESIKHEFNVNGLIEWKIDGMSQLLKRERTCMQYSPAFYTNEKGYKACIRGHFGNGNASFYLCMLKGENDNRLKWPFKGQCSIRLINEQTGNQFESKQQVKGDIPGAKMPKKSNNLCSLCHYICDESTLCKTGVFENDCITVIGEIKESTALANTKKIRKEDIRVVSREIQAVIHAY